MLTTHPAYNKLVELGKEQKKNIHVGRYDYSRCSSLSLIPFTVLQEMLAKLKAESKADSLTELTKDIHLYPDLHGTCPSTLIIKVGLLPTSFLPITRKQVTYR